MPAHNADIARIFRNVAEYLEINGANAFRVRAYENAARTVESMARDVADMVAADEDLSGLPGIGEDLAKKIREIVDTGSLPLLEKLRAENPPGLLELLRVEGLGPKRVGILREKLGVESLDDLRKAVDSGAVRDLEGFGEKSEAKIGRALSALEKGRVTHEMSRMRLDEAEGFALPLLDHIRAVEGVVRAEPAGSLRRRKETVGDLDMVAVCDDPEKGPARVMDAFAAYDRVEEVVSKGETRATVRLRNGPSADLRVVPAESFGAALHYLTGSKAHNVRLRGMAEDQGCKVNEYGVFRGEERVAGETEEDLYAFFGMDFIPPELREDTGELEAARKHRLPALVTLADMRGDLHAHTDASDGRAGLEEMAEAARSRGYDYLAITDHSQAVTVAHGLDADRLAALIDAVDRVNDGLSGITLLKGCEVDILEDGSLDLPDSILKRLDLTVCSVHSRFGLPRDAQTERIVRAMDNPHFTILGHPTGRLIGKREPYAVNMERVIAAAAERGVFLELNAHPERLDLDDRHCRAAKEAGVLVAVSTDAHSPGGLDTMRFGLGQARRGWLEAKDVLNTRSLRELKKLLKR
ncbi:PHP domain protein [Desulfovibrio sp. X2]|uniref:DNA polymerase/3'-5' exonuclease PolX n=1 Tax=Desulfovibrio sp. X2 TaxID=941449 RepID=UPI000358EACE|nr:DNA polymerase/3'-5' exonuclease PolX [Desulfovibrio sp. X2]EPR44284.1 PHP domain protein [Desulfovibrio sp. X2]